MVALILLVVVPVVVAVAASPLGVVLAIGAGYLGLSGYAGGIWFVVAALAAYSASLGLVAGVTIGSAGGPRILGHLLGLLSFIIGIVLVTLWGFGQVSINVVYVLTGLPHVAAVAAVLNYRRTAGDVA